MLLTMFLFQCYILYKQMYIYIYIFFIRNNIYICTEGIKFGSKFGSIVKGAASMISSLSTLLFSIWCSKSISLTSRLYRFWYRLHVDVKLWEVFFSEHTIASVVIEQFAALKSEKGWLLFFSSAQSQYFCNSKSLLLNVVLTPKRLSVEFISILQVQIIHDYNNL